ncbi:MAG: SagB/ThcOx family dehydrogenase [Dehalococcoidia bacterium]|nr:SagB/ThcOx family dehydrogenase [Dehalococcoidia bacterium]
MVKLPAPRKRGEISVEETLQKRRSERSFASKELSWEQISQLLWSAQGMVERGFRTAPSAGATYPLEVYLVTSNGVYHYKPESHQLEPILEGDVRSQLCRACLNQEWIEEAPVSIVIAAVYQRTGRGYGPRAARYVHIEVGHAAQNIHLQAVALGLGSVPVGAFGDEQVQRVLSLPENQQPLYIVPVGYVAE